MKQNMSCHLLYKYGIILTNNSKETLLKTSLAKHSLFFALNVRILPSSV